MNILETKNIVKKYEKHTALNGVSIAVPRQSIFGLLGPNGAGKTSLIRIITQITAADEGEVRFEGELLQPKHAQQIGYLPEERGLYKKMKVAEQLLYLAQLRDVPYQVAKDKLRVWFEKLDLMEWWNKNIEELSKGMQQKVQFIATVLHEPKLLILDEPFSGFDPVNSNIIRDEILALKEKGTTIIFSTHRMDNVEEMCDELVLINHAQKILGGKKNDVKRQFKSNLFTIETQQPLANLPENFALSKVTNTTDNTFLHQINLLQGTANDILGFAIAQTSVIRFEEHLPSIHDIFVKVVEEGKQ
jgi:ABC-2 type transport system ATP-binding protein